MALTSASTLVEVEAAYDDNASYEEDGSSAKCRAFITACLIWLRRAPREQGTREGNLTLSPDLVQKELTHARSWLASNPNAGNPSGGGTGGTGTGGPSNAVADLSSFRG